MWKAKVSRTFGLRISHTVHVLMQCPGKIPALNRQFRGRAESFLGRRKTCGNATGKLGGLIMEFVEVDHEPVAGV